MQSHRRTKLRMGKDQEVPIQVTVTMDQSKAKELNSYKQLVNKHYKEPGTMDRVSSKDLNSTIINCYDFHLFSLIIDDTTESIQAVTTTSTESEGI